jgi:hypothetical protein
VISGPDADRLEPRGDLCGARIEIAVRNVRTVTREGDALGREHRLVLDDAGKVQCGGVMLNHGWWDVERAAAKCTLHSSQCSNRSFEDDVARSNPQFFDHQRGDALVAE